MHDDKNPQDDMRPLWRAIFVVVVGGAIIWAVGILMIGGES